MLGVLLFDLLLTVLTLLWFDLPIFQAVERKLKEQLEERRKFPLEDRLRQHLVGQEGPITAVAAGKFHSSGYCLQQFDIVSTHGYMH